jgi:hypothetical protein
LSEKHGRGVEYDEDNNTEISVKSSTWKFKCDDIEFYENIEFIQIEKGKNGNPRRAAVEPKVKGLLKFYS